MPESAQFASSHKAVAAHSNPVALCVIPARAGSSRIPRKNLAEITAGKSLVRLAYECAEASGVFRHIVVSTDNGEMADGLPWLRRPEELSGPTADISDAVRHALLETEASQKKRFEYVATLQPAVPLRDGRLIRQMLVAMCAHRCCGAITGVPVVPWLWTSSIEGDANNSWTPNAYPRSQEFAGQHRWQEINTVQMADRDTVLSGKRWNLPLLVQLLPSYAALDIDDESDLRRAQCSYEHLLRAFEVDNFDPPFVVRTINGLRSV